MCAHHNQVTTALLGDIHDAGSRGGTGQSSAQTRAGSETFRNVVVEGFFKRSPIRVRAIRTLGMKENQLCPMLGGKLVRERRHMRGARIERCGTDYFT